MAHMEAHAKIRASKHRLLGAVAAVIHAFTAWRKAVAGRRALADLTPYELKDIGCADVLGPTFSVRVGLITDLMSMR
ncbi:conserved hypothetical protein [Mesorhizobium plurifarium]|uniref:YjiS-like domain-containing protein n=1 Tax=Mesorhizobium plurifarium TaxID=69974 RepID=A0A090GD04_MESPL|nr:conserved hypothetical protein [Mesorhizobium plurifarium]